MPWTHTKDALGGFGPNELATILSECCIAVNERRAILGRTEYSFATPAGVKTRPVPSDFIGMAITGYKTILATLRTGIANLSSVEFWYPAGVDPHGGSGAQRGTKGFVHPTTYALTNLAELMTLAGYSGWLTDPGARRAATWRQVMAVLELLRIVTVETNNGILTNHGRSTGWAGAGGGTDPSGFEDWQTNWTNIGAPIWAHRNDAALAGAPVFSAGMGVSATWYSPPGVYPWQIVTIAKGTLSVPVGIPPGGELLRTAKEWYASHPSSAAGPWEVTDGEDTYTLAPGAEGPLILTRSSFAGGHTLTGGYLEMPLDFTVPTVPPWTYAHLAGNYGPSSAFASYMTFSRLNSLWNVAPAYTYG